MIQEVRRHLCWVESRRIVWLAGIVFTCVMLVQYFELPYGSVVISIFSSSNSHVLDNGALSTVNLSSQGKQLGNGTLPNGLNSTHRDLFRDGTTNVTKIPGNPNEADVLVQGLDADKYAEDESPPKDAKEIKMLQNGLAPKAARVPVRSFTPNTSSAERNGTPDAPSVSLPSVVSLLPASAGATPAVPSVALPPGPGVSLLPASAGGTLAVPSVALPPGVSLLPASAGATPTNPYVSLPPGPGVSLLPASAGGTPAVPSVALPPGVSLLPASAGATPSNPSVALPPGPGVSLVRASAGGTPAAPSLALPPEVSLLPASAGATPSNPYVALPPGQAVSLLPASAGGTPEIPSVTLPPGVSLLPATAGATPSNPYVALPPGPGVSLLPASAGGTLEVPAVALPPGVSLLPATAGATPSNPSVALPPGPGVSLLPASAGVTPAVPSVALPLGASLPHLSNPPVLYPNLQNATTRGVMNPDSQSLVAPNTTSVHTNVGHEAPDSIRSRPPFQGNNTARPENRSSNSVVVPRVKVKPKRPTEAVFSISDMNHLLVQSRLSTFSKVQKPLWHSAADQELLNAKIQIANAPLIENHRELDSVLYKNVSLFIRSYELMEHILKVYIYNEGEKPIWHQPTLNGIYASEGWFMKLLKENRHFITKDPSKAHLFYLPFSSRRLEEALYVPDSHSRRNLVVHLKNYLDMIKGRHNFWNRTGGADHFLVACHDWAPAETKRYMATCIRALCNSDVKEGFAFGKDVSLPETKVSSPQNPIKDLGGKPASQRKVLAFFAGRMHGYVRPILLQHWKNDPDMKITGRMNKTTAGNKVVKGEILVDYRQYMKSSKYCICPKGYEVNSPRVVEAIFYECVPVIISDNFVPPFFEVLNWESFAIFIPEKDIPNLKKILLSIPTERYVELQRRVKAVQKHFLWHVEPQKYDIFHMILHSIWLNRVSQMQSS